MAVISNVALCLSRSGLVRLVGHSSPCFRVIKKKAGESAVPQASCEGACGKYKTVKASIRQSRHKTVKANIRQPRQI
jgi:hypothetical protein